MPNGKWSDLFMVADKRPPSTIAGINQLEKKEKRAIFVRLVPTQLFDIFDLSETLIDPEGNDLVHLKAVPGSPVAEMAVYHRHGFRDPVVYGQITDTLNGQIHIMLYVINDPEAPRFDTDVMPDGSPTAFGVIQRNIPAEIAAMQAGLAPGQVRHGLRLMRHAANTFEDFAKFLGHDRYFTEPLYYHNAVLLERAGFAYLRGRRLMEKIDAGFAPGGEYRRLLDGSTPFRQPEAAESIRLRSWALHDNLLDEPFQDVTMYKVIGKHAGIQTSTCSAW
jgi:hypothetical protein